jgi:hypothetical protein
MAPTTNSSRSLRTRVIETVASFFLSMAIGSVSGWFVSCLMFSEMNQIPLETVIRWSLEVF